jgi:opacity protein-like surface antigen
MRLVQISMLVLFLILFTGLAQAQLVFGVQGGIGGSMFEDQKEAASSVPVGVYVGTNALPLFDVGVEYNMLVVPFKFEGQVLTEKIKTEFTQSYYGAFIKWYVLPLPILEPYVKAGAAYYTGKIKVELAGASHDEKFKNTLGFNIGAGVKTMTGLYGEFVVHLLSRELDTENVDPGTAKKAAYNNWMLMVGYQFEL